MAPAQVKKDPESTWLKRVKIATECCNRNIADMSEADTLAILTDRASTSGGFHVEFGHFLGWPGTNIVVAGPRPNPFFWADRARYFGEVVNIERLTDWLLSDQHGAAID